MVKTGMMWFVIALALTLAGCQNAELTMCQQENNMLNSEMVVLEDKLAVALTVNETVRTENQEKARQLSTEIDGLEKANRELLARNAAYADSEKEKLATINKELLATRENTAKMTAQIESLSKELTLAKNDGQQANQNNAELQDKINATQAQNLELTAQLELLKKQNEELTIKISELENILAELKDEK